MLKKYDELRKIDVTPYCEERDGLLYLNWAKCIDLLYENGAEKVEFQPLVNEKGSSLFYSDLEFVDKNGTKNKCYEVAIKLIIDDKEYIFRSPVMNGGNPVKDNSMSQLRVWTAQCRALVKCVAINTGLGFDLWLKNENDETKGTTEDNLNRHDIFKIEERVEQLATAKMKEKNWSKEELAKALGLLDEAELKNYFSYFKIIDRLEKAITKL